MLRCSRRAVVLIACSAGVGLGAAALPAASMAACMQTITEPLVTATTTGCFTEDSSDATLFTTSPLLMNEADRTTFSRFADVVRLTRYGGDCYSYCMLAAGHLDLVVETELKPYDITALIPIITGAGGVVTNWEGGPAQSGGRIIAAGDKRVHEEALKLLRG